MKEWVKMMENIVFEGEKFWVPFLVFIHIYAFLLAVCGCVCVYVCMCVCVLHIVLIVAYPFGLGLALAVSSSSVVFIFWSVVFLVSLTFFALVIEGFSLTSSSCLLVLLNASNDEKLGSLG